MARPLKDIAAFGLPPLRQHWQEMNRERRQAEARERASRKARDKRRRKCRCEAYPWPHRPGGGFCRHPDLPVERWQPKPKPGGRPYRERYAGLRRQIARANGLHPIRDRKTIESLLPQALSLAKELKRRAPQYKYRNMEITETGICGNRQSAGPMM
jgi:hypothetical protein